MPLSARLLVVVLTSACGRIAFDRQDAAAAGADAPCAPTLFGPTDDFSAGGLLEFMVYQDPGTTAVEESGVLKLRPAPTVIAYTGATTISLGSFRGVAAVVELVNPPSNILGAQCGFYVLGSETSDGFLLEANVLFAYPRGSLVGVPYDPIAHRWLRLREQDGTLYFDARPTTGRWITLIALPAGSWLDAPVSLRLEAGTYLSVAAPGEAHFDNLNLPPPGC